MVKGFEGFENFKKKIPQRRDVVRFYGAPGTTPDPDKRGFILVDNDWYAENIVLIPINILPEFPLYQAEQTVTGVRLHRNLELFFKKTWEEVVRRGLAKRVRSYDGAFTPRFMLSDPSRDLSMHAYGAAIDFDARWNGYGLSPDRIQIDRDFVRCMEECGWSWGGRWEGITDAMHFEVVQPHINANWNVEPEHENVPPVFRRAKQRGFKRPGKVKLYRNGNLLYMEEYELGDTSVRLNADHTHDTLHIDVKDHVTEV